VRAIKPVGAVALLAGALAGCFVAGRATVTPGGPRNPIVLERGIPSIRQSTIAAGGSDRRNDPRGMALWANGGQSFTLIGASRLDWYRTREAQVTSWAGQVFWGPGRAPTQAWALAQTTLAWRNGRWVVLAMRALPDPAPSPAALSGADPRAQSSVAFYSQLRGFTPVSYGAPG
jgi:hypothetical protein